mmetsp:Transcript_19038/g.45722  ORF Transcript_19038/g.45722 Transcript_19038/m.45722 type:complete len:202 (+) Transcript_19038:816-1421(+)
MNLVCSSNSIRVVTTSMQDPEGNMDLMLDLASQERRGSSVVTTYAPRGMGEAATPVVAFATAFTASIEYDLFPDSARVIHPLRNFRWGSTCAAPPATKFSTLRGDTITGTMHRARTTRFPAPPPPDVPTPITTRSSSSSRLLMTSTRVSTTSRHWLHTRKSTMSESPSGASYSGSCLAAAPVQTAPSLCPASSFSSLSPIR